MKKIPQHIVLFPDGNRRWAKKRGINSFKGHQQGYKNLLDFGSWCSNRGVKVLTAFGFSTENWKRSKAEVDYLMKLLETGLYKSLNQFQRDGVQVKIMGERNKLPKSLKKAINKVEEATKNNKKLHLNLAVSYGGKWDILQAIQRIIEEKTRALKELSARPSTKIKDFSALVPTTEDITEEYFESYLSTAGLPAPDLIIRAGGEMRLSNFLLWQAAYAELYFSPKLWPDFTQKDLDLAFAEFDSRARRFGG